MSAIFAATNASAATNGTVASTAKAVRFNHSDLLFNVDVFLLCAVAIFVLLLLPRAAIRFTHKREWVDGHLLRALQLDNRVTVARRPTQLRSVISPVSPAYISEKTGEYGYRKDQWDSTTDASHTYASHNAPDLFRKASSGSTQDASHTYASNADLWRKASSATTRQRRRQNVPTHMPGWSTMLPTLASRLRITIHPGLTIGKGIVLLGYFAILLYAGLFKSNPLTDPIRAGYVAGSQIPIVIIFATKNNLVGMLIGFGYERLNYLHRFAGKMFVLASNLHAIGYFYSWSLNGKFHSSIARPSNQWGMVVLVSADLLYLLSTDFFRQRFYNTIFIPSHIILAVVLLVSVCQHTPWVVPYVVIAVGLYGLDRVMRLIKSRVATAYLRPIPDLGMTRVELRGINAGWRTGQHVRLRVLSSGMGWRAWAEAHPFTIASVSRDPSGEGMVLMVKKAGDWTNKLYELARRAEYGEAQGTGGTVRVVVEGPYGGPGHAIFASFSGAMFVAGGSGITFALAAVQDLVKKDIEEKSRIRALQLVWSVQDPAALTPLLPTFTSLLAQSYDGYAALRISVFYTRAPPSPDVFKAFRALPPGLTLSPARPNLAKILSSTVDRSAALFSGGRERKRGGGGLTGVIVGVCGPAGLGDGVRKAVADFDPKRRNLVGGIELHEEAFGW